MVIMLMPASTVSQSTDSEGSATIMVRTSRAKPASLEAVDRKPVIGVGAPS